MNQLNQIINTPHRVSQGNNCSLQEVLLQNLPATAAPKLLCSLRRELQKVPRIPCEPLTDEEQITRLNMLIGRLLDKADVTTASRLEEMFSHRNQVTYFKNCVPHCWLSEAGLCQP
jgi:hypothetical protein